MTTITLRLSTNNTRDPIPPKAVREATAAVATAITATRFPILSQHYPDLFKAANDHKPKRKRKLKKKTLRRKVAKRRSAFADEIWSVEHKPGLSKCGVYNLQTSGEGE